jgi:hypothetical protein
MTYQELLAIYGDEEKADWIADEITNALDAGCFDSQEDPELLAYAERGYKRAKAEGRA